MTLREEIKNIIYSEVASTDSGDVDGEEEATAKILKLFAQTIKRNLAYFHNGFIEEGIMHLEDLKEELGK